MIGCHPKECRTSFRVRLRCFFMGKSGRLGTSISYHALHLRTAPTCIFVGATGVSAVLNLTNHDELQDDFSEPILDAATIIIRPGISTC